MILAPGGARSFLCCPGPWAGGLSRCAAPPDASLVGVWLDRSAPCARLTRAHPSLGAHHESNRLVTIVAFRVERPQRVRAVTEVGSVARRGKPVWLRPSVPATGAVKLLGVERDEDVVGHEGGSGWGCVVVVSAGNGEANDVVPSGEAGGHFSVVGIGTQPVTAGPEV